MEVTAILATQERIVRAIESLDGESALDGAQGRRLGKKEESLRVREQEADWMSFCPPRVTWVLHQFIEK
jgi:hypothetical protein